MDDCKIFSSKKSKKAILSDVYTLKVPNFFILPEYDKPFEMNSPSFEFANAFWYFQISSKGYTEGYSRFSVFMERINSEIPRQLIIYKIKLLDPHDKKHQEYYDGCEFEEDGEPRSLMTFSNFKDKSDFLTVTVHLIWHEVTEPDTLEAPRIQDLHDKMAEKKKDCEISLTLSKKLVCYDVYTFKLSNLRTLQEYGATAFEINSPSFKFADETWHFQLLSYNLRKKFTASVLRLNSEKHNLKEIFYKKIYLATWQFNNEGESSYWDKVRDFKYKDEVWKMDFTEGTPSYTSVDTLTLNLHLFPYEILDEHANHMPLTTKRDMNMLCRDFMKLFLNGKKQDLTLRVADKEFRVHRDILMARSEVFEAMLSRDMMDKNEDFIELPDSDPKAMEQLLFYVYSGTVETLDQDNVFGLYHEANKYGMTLLKEMCAEYIKKSLSPSLIGEVIQFALDHNDSDLLEFATEYFVNHTSDILPTMEWMSFIKLNFTVANELLIKASKKWDSAKS